jgi:hypothetical protein
VRESIYFRRQIVTFQALSRAVVHSYLASTCYFAVILTPEPGFTRRKAAPLRSTQLVRISVYLLEQDLSEVAAHECSRSLAKKLLVRDARQVGQNAIQLRTAEPWQAVKARYRPAPAQVEIPPAKRASWKDHLLIYYPIKDQRTIYA